MTTRKWALLLTILAPLPALCGPGRMALSPVRLVAGGRHEFVFTYTVGPAIKPKWPGRFGRCVKADGPLDLRFPALGNFNVKEGTIEFWFKPLSPSFWSDGEFHRLFDLYRFPREIVRYQIVKHAENILRFQVFVGKSGWNADLDVSNRKDTNWHHVAATWRNVGSGRPDAELRLYLDGGLVASVEGVRIPLPRLKKADSFCVGHAVRRSGRLTPYYDSLIEPAMCLIDELRIEGKALPPSEFALSLPPKVDGETLFLAHFDESLNADYSKGPGTCDLGTDGMRDGATLAVLLPPCWSPPQTKDPGGEGYLTVKLPRGRAEVEVEKLSRDLDWCVKVRVKGTSLKPGERIVVTYGDRSKGGPGARVQRFSQLDIAKAKLRRMPICLDDNADGILTELPWRFRESVNPSVLPGPPAKFHVVAPSIVKPGERFTVRLAVTDRWLNLAGEPYSGRLSVKCTDPDASLPGGLRISPEDGNHKAFEVALPTPGVHYIAVEGEGGVRGESNPVLVLADFPYRLYWGDIHGHTEFSDGMLSPEDYFRYGRDVALLDFCAITDHERWHLSATKKFNAPGRFVTFLAFEYSWHPNLYFESEEDWPLADGGKWPRGMRPPTLAALLEFLEKRKIRCLVVPHHLPAAYSKGMLEVLKRSPLVRLVEVYSMWGSSERFPNPLWEEWKGRGIGAVDFLNAGLKVGFIASSDNHHGRPGQCIDESGWYPNLNHRGGLAAVFAKALTRREVFRSLWERRCYGTTGERMLLIFKVNGTLMGGEAEASGPRRVEFLVAGTAPIEKVEIVRNGEVVKTFEGEGRRVVRGEFADREPLRGQAYYYLRATQATGDIAWSSPVWVEPRG